jgi:hypothetical protein
MNGREFGRSIARRRERETSLTSGMSQGTVASLAARDASHAPRQLGSTARALVACVGVWSFVLIPWEVHGGGGIAPILALLVSKALLVLLVVCTLRGVGGARMLFTFVCAVSVIAIGFDLPLEYAVLRTGFYLSAIDCLLKLAAALMLVSHYSHRAGG